jgi:NAD(P)-dependent dehydrogenase (short-subunit alcohol dehydrogenase family)
MTLEPQRPALQDKKALIVGIANDASIAYGCANAFAELGAKLAITYLNAKAKDHAMCRPNSPVISSARPANQARRGYVIVLAHPVCPSKPSDSAIAR